MASSDSEDSATPPPAPRVALSYGERPNPAPGRRGRQPTSARAQPLTDSSTFQEAPLLENLPRRRPARSNRPGYANPFDALEALRNKPLEEDAPAPQPDPIKTPGSVFPKRGLSIAVAMDKRMENSPHFSHEELQKTELDLSPQSFFPYARRGRSHDRGTEADPTLHQMGHGNRDAFTYKEMEKYAVWDNKRKLRESIMREEREKRE